MGKVALFASLLLAGLLGLMVFQEAARTSQVTPLAVSIRPGAGAASTVVAQYAEEPRTTFKPTGGTRIGPAAANGEATSESEAGSARQPLVAVVGASVNSAVRQCQNRVNPQDAC